MLNHDLYSIFRGDSDSGIKKIHFPPQMTSFYKLTDEKSQLFQRNIENVSKVDFWTHVQNRLKNQPAMFKNDFFLFLQHNF